MEMPAISLWQPFGSLLFTTPRKKIHETRSWAFPRQLTGKRVVIHAAKRPIRAGEIDHLLSLDLPNGWFDQLPYGCALGTVLLAYAKKVSMPAPLYGATPEDELCGDFSTGRWIWRCEDPQPFEQPIPARGAQGFWTFEAMETA